MGGVGYGLVLTVHVLAGLGVIVLVLLQHGKGADMGAAFGSGSSGSLFGASGSASFLSRMTAGLATVFFITSLGLNYLGEQRSATSSGSVMEGAAAAIPAVEVPAPPPAAPAAADGKVQQIPR